MKYSLYVHIFPNGKRYYGITTQDVNRRWGKGSGYSGQKLIYNAIKKYGWDNIEHKVLFERLDKDVACLLEQSYIALYNTNNIEFGYNVQIGGTGGNYGIPNTKALKLNMDYIKGYDKTKTKRDNLSFFLIQIHNDVNQEHYINCILRVFHKELNYNYSKLDWSLMSYEKFLNHFRSRILKYAMECNGLPSPGFTDWFLSYMKMIVPNMIVEQDRLIDRINYKRGSSYDV